MSIQAMKQALEDLQKIEIIRTEYFELLFNAKKILRAAIAEQEKCEPVATVKIVEHLPDELEMLAVFHPPFAVSDGTKLFTHPAPVPDGCKNDAARWNFVMSTEPYALNLWNALPKNLYQQERHLNTAIDQAMLAAAPQQEK